jgi:hypothetical protein
MLQKLHIKGFKGFRDFQLTDISRVTLVGGKNNIGKTSLLEAIFLFYDRANPGMFFRHLGWRGIDIPLTDAESLFSPIFTDFNMENTISFKVNDGIYEAKMQIKFEPSLAQKDVSVDVSSFGNTGTPLQTDTLTAISYYMNIHYEVSGVGQEDVAIVLRKTPTNVNIQFKPHPVSIIPGGMMQKAIFFPLRLQVNPGEEAARFSELDVVRKVDRVVEFLKIIEPHLVGLTAVTPLPQSPAIYADIQGMSRKIPVALLGDGMSKLLSVILAIATANNGIVLIDEIDAGIHYSVLSKVWEGIFKAAKDFNCQVVATTHNYECLQAASNAASQAGAEDDFSYVRLQIHENNIIAKQYTHSVLGAALEQGWEVR